MSRWSVTDVQKALRDYADRGHDVLSDPQYLMLNGKRYGLAVSHHLSFHGTTYKRRPASPEPETALTSHLMQSERPLVSTVFSRKQKTPMGAQLMIPELTYRNNKIDAHHFGHATVTADDISFAGGEGVHDVLKHHQKMVVPDFGITRRADTVDSYIDTNPMTAEERSQFNPKEALSNLVRVGNPFDGLIRVHLNSEFFAPSHVYDPRSERLLEL